MNTDNTKEKKRFFVEGPVSPETIAKSIANHSSKKNIGAHDIFLGQVRDDIINGMPVQAIEYTAYKEMAEKEMERIREDIIIKYNLTCAHILHSMGIVKTGEISLYVLVSSAHREASFDACREMVDLIKKEVPIFGKEILDNGTYAWKENKD
jgi:molybdopterin synthase catalytic subunit